MPASKVSSTRRLEPAQRGGHPPRATSSLSHQPPLTQSRRSREPRRYEAHSLPLAREASDKGWWEEYADIFSEEYIALIGLEAEARAEWSWHLDLIPGLLQTEAYARSVNSQFESVMGPAPPSKIERRIRARLRRQQILWRDPPLEHSLVLDESVLRRKLAVTPVMREQLAHLAELAQLPNVTLRIFPLAEINPVVVNSFDLLLFGTEPGTATMPDVVWTEHLGAALYFEGEADT